MSFEWTSQPLSIQSIASQYALPVAIRAAPGFRGSSRPVILHSISRTTFAYGRALRVSQSTTNEYKTYKPIDSEIVAIPMKYPAYFECLPSRNNAQQVSVVAEKHIQPIVERMQVDHRPQAFYIVSPMQVYTLEINSENIAHRVWHQIDAHQIIVFDKLVQIEYTPTENDNLTPEDYEYSWLFCLGKHVLTRNDYVLKCILLKHQICYIPCSSIDEVNLIPVGQRGSTSANKLQTIQNLVQHFPLPMNIKLAQLPGSYAYKDFNGSLQLLGSRTEEFAVCASLNSSNIAVCPINTPLKFVVSSVSSSTPQIQTILSSCHIFIQSFDMQIRRILVSSHHDTSSSRRTRSRNPKIQAAIEDQFKRFKRSNSHDHGSTMKDDQTTTTDEGYRSGSSAVKKRNNPKQQRSASVDFRDGFEHMQRRMTLSTDEDTAYNSLVYPGRPKKNSIPTSSPLPPALPKKPPNFPYPPTPFTYDSGSNFIEDIDSSNADGAILMDPSNELFLTLPSDTRFT